MAYADQPGLSGVKEIRYSTNNGSSWQIAAGASASVEQLLSELALIRSRQNLLSANVDLMKALGGGWQAEERTAGG